MNLPTLFAYNNDQPRNHVCCSFVRSFVRLLVRESVRQLGACVRSRRGVATPQTFSFFKLIKIKLTLNCSNRWMSYAMCCWWWWWLEPKIRLFHLKNIFILQPSEAAVRCRVAQRIFEQAY